ncbi:MAG: methionine adenosyltransferase, partial [Erysipelotrichaceae bacterium]|nr:methionine adenosyltransferase [Erysipelotrichaceae bacterium]
MKLFSNEIVFRGHPDKVCDQISAAILDECLRQDRNSRCGIETVGGKGKIFITGEITTKAHFSAQEIARRVLRDIGYPDDYEIIDNIGKQSADIALGTNDEVAGAGDQGMMFGYACNDTKELLPVAMVILQRLAEKYDELVHTHKDFYPDGKAQITGIYDDDFNLVKIKDFTISYNNSETNREETDAIIRKT